MKVHKGDVGGMWGEGGLRILIFPFFLTLFFLVRNPYYKAWRGRSDDGFVEGSVCVYIPDVKKKKARKEEKKKKRKIIPALHGLIRWCSISSKK